MYESYFGFTGAPFLLNPDPSFYFDSASGFELTAPYYWNIAPNRDATIAPTLSARRGVGADRLRPRRDRQDHREREARAL